MSKNYEELKFTDDFMFCKVLENNPNICKEQPDLELKDAAFKVFVNARGRKDDLSEDMKAFLDYLCGRKSESELVKEIDAEVEKARSHEEWRNEYMTLLMRDQEKREEGFGLAAKILDYLTNHPSDKAEEIAEKLSCSVEQVMQIRNLMKL